MEPEPIVAGSGLISQEQGSAAIDAHQDIQSSIVVEIPHRQAAGGPALLECAVPL